MVLILTSLPLNENAEVRAATWSSLMHRYRMRWWGKSYGLGDPGPLDDEAADGRTLPLELTELKPIRQLVSIEFCTTEIP
jgi:hypothetical protein